MARHTATLSAQNTQVLVCKVHKPRKLDTYFVSILASGTFGSGTVTLNASVDGGSTLIPLKDALGNAATLTAAGNVNLSLGTPNAVDDVLGIYASIATATNPSISINAFDNIG